MPQRYSLAAITLHWTIAALLAFQISVGWALESLGARGFALFQLHKSIGITVLALTVLRVVVRYWKPRPAKLEGGWQGALASGVHAGLYLFMLGAPLTGWALVSTAKVKVPTLIFGLIPLPHLPLPMAAHELTENAHGLLAWIGIALVALHVAGALRHHLLMRDGLIWRMMPARSVLLLVGLPAMILVGFGIGQAILPAPAPKPASEPAAVAEPELAPLAEPEPAQPAAAENSSAVANAASAVEEEAEAPPAPPPAWAVQPGGTIGFSVKNSGETIDGSFKRWNAKIIMDPDHPQSAEIKVTIDMTSVSVGAYYQDSITDDEFFAVSAHPKATFSAKGATRTGTDSYRANGMLTLKGVTRPQSIRFTLSGAGATRKVKGTATVARAAYGVGNGDSSGGIDAQVAVSFAFTAKKAL